MKKLSISFYFILFILSFLGCKDSYEKQNKINQPDKFSFHLRIFGGLGPLQQILIKPDWDSAYYLFSTPLLEDDPKSAPYKLQNKFAFKLSQVEKDSIFIMSNAALSNFNFLEENTGNLDGEIIEVSLSHNGKTLQATYAGLDKIQNASPEVKALIEFFNRKLAGKVSLE